MDFVGRTKELELLKMLYAAKRSELVVIYGRRRIGKSTLINQFLSDKDQAYSFEGIEDGQKQEQIDYFAKQLAKQLGEPLIARAKFSDWSEVFDLITEKIASLKGRKIIFFDEYQWMSSGQSKLTALLKFYWDNYWSKSNLLLILCGSIASFMVKKVIYSKALYGRINHQILLKQLSPNESIKFFRNKRSPEEVLKYLLIFGGVPKYLEQIDLNQSFSKNITRLCFDKNSFFTQEAEKIFYSQFKETKIYLRIVKLLKDKALTFDQISKALKIKSGGGLKLYLDNLLNAEIIASYTSILDKANTKFVKYRLVDEFLIFYYKFIEPNLNHIQDSRGNSKIFEKTIEPSWMPWLGFAFERFVLRHSYYFASIMGFEEEVIAAAPLLEKQQSGFQVDLIYKRSDKVFVLSEVKYYNKPIGLNIIPEIEQKLKSFMVPRSYSIEKALISVHGMDKNLEDCEYFHHTVDVSKIFT